MFIKNHVQGLWPDECANNGYPGLDKLVCFACHPDQPKYTDTNQNIIRICESLIKDFYDFDNRDLDVPTGAYEECGGWNSSDSYLKPVSDEDPTLGFEVVDGDEVLVFPKSAFENA